MNIRGSRGGGKGGTPEVTTALCRLSRSLTRVPLCAGLSQEIKDAHRDLKQRFGFDDKRN